MKHAADRPIFRNGKCPSVCFFLSGIILVCLSESVALIGGGSASKYIAIAVKILSASLIFGLASFARSLPAYLSRLRASVWTLAASGIGAIAVALRVTARFYNTFFREILNGGTSPVIVYRIYEKLPLPEPLLSLLIRVSVVTAGLLAVFSLFCLLLHLLHIAREVLRCTRTGGTDAACPLPRHTLLRSRVIWAALLAVAVGTLCFLAANKGQDWGADYALYMQQGIDLANGKTDMQAAWGLSAVLSIVYRLCGWNMTSFDTLLYYKLPGILCLALVCFVLFLFFSKRFSLLLSALLTALIGLHPINPGLINCIWTDIPHLLFTVVSLLCMYALFSRRSTAQQVLFACLTGVFMWTAQFFRAAGLAVIVTLPVVQILYLLGSKWAKRGVLRALAETAGRQHWYVHVLPYAVYGLLYALVYSRVPYAATRGSLTGYTALDSFLPNIAYYWQLLSGYFASVRVYGFFLGAAVWLIPCLLLLGVWRGFRKELIACVYFVIYAVSLLFNWANNGIRYALPLLPILLLFIGIGIQTVLLAVRENAPQQTRAFRVARLGAVWVIALLLFDFGGTAIVNLRNDRAFDHMSYSTDAIEAYRYIQENTASDSHIVFFKSAVIELNTGHGSSSLIETDRSMDQYLLITSDSGYDQLIPDVYADVSELEAHDGVTLAERFRNERFVLYQVLWR